MIDYEGKVLRLFVFTDRIFQFFVTLVPIWTIGRTTTTRKGPRLIPLLRAWFPFRARHGDKRNLSFRAVRFQETFSWSKLDGRFFAPFWPIHIIADPAILLNFTRAYWYF